MAPDDLSPSLAAPGTTAEATPEATPGTAPLGPRQTLAMRLAARNRQRELRAERLARLRPPATPDSTPDSTAGPGAPAPLAMPASAEAAEAALEDFLRSLTGDLPSLPEGPPIEPGELLPFQRPAERASQTGLQAGWPADDLDRLPGVGPGLVWALERAGLRRLADLAPLAPSELAARLGPLGRLVPAERWIAAARAVAD